MGKNKENWLFVCLCALVFFGCLLIFLLFLRGLFGQSGFDENNDWRMIRRTEVDVNRTEIWRTYDGCTYALCFDVHRCLHDSLNVYLYPLQDFVDKKSGKFLNPAPSREYLEIRKWIRQSRFFEANPQNACVMIPGVDTLNQNRISGRFLGKILTSLDWWDGGWNHVVFNMLPGSVPDYNTTLDGEIGRALIAGGGFDLTTYRRTFDVAIPVWNPLTRDYRVGHDRFAPDSADMDRYLMVANLAFADKSYKKVLDRIVKERDAETKVLLLDSCSANKKNDRFDRVCGFGSSVREHFPYPAVLERAEFCLIVESTRLGQTLLSDAVQTGCIPVIVSNRFVLPFSEVLDWKRASVQLYNHQLPRVLEILAEISPKEMRRMQIQLKHFWENYFKNMSLIVETTLKILEDRIYPHKARSYREWNEPEHQKKLEKTLFLPRIAPNEGFTAVVLSYDRIPSLYKSIRLLGGLKSLKKVVVVWNNPAKNPPKAKDWPTITKPIEVIKMKENKLGNRFVPFKAIETEAVLSLDDDIVGMLNPDEIEFAYQVWREFSSYLVGFPSRIHVYDPNTKRFHYNSEWTNNVSMILTGAAFYHKFYGYLYTTQLPEKMKRLVEKRMNCEDIAMNFLIAQHTGQPAIKVTPKKKFRCPECSAGELATDVKHLTERSECIRLFAKVLNVSEPLKIVDFRVDPLLFKNSAVPDYLKQFPGVKSV